MKKKIIIFAFLTICITLACSVFSPKTPPQPANGTIPMETTIPGKQVTDQPAVVTSTSLPEILPTNTIGALPIPVTPSETVSAPQKTIVGLWERRTSTTTEQFNLQDDGTYTIEARKNSTNKVFASDHGTFAYDESNLYTINQANKKVTEVYYLDNEGDTLVINHQIGSAWTRVK